MGMKYRNGIQISNISIAPDNLQEKTVNITSNGTIEVLPDGEYTGLSKVNINANVPDSIPYAQAMIDGSEYVGDIPNNTTEIMAYAFYYKRNLKGGLILPEGLMRIGVSAFSECTGLTGALIIPNLVTNIENSAFYNCSQLTNIMFGNGLTNIGNNAFLNCSNLTSITIPNSVTSVGSSLFGNCNALISVKIGNGVEKVTSMMFSRCPNLQSIDFGNNITTIDGYAFQYCNKLASVIIPNNVTSIGDSAFQYCNITNLKLSENLNSLGTYCFYSALSNLTGELTIPAGITTVNFRTFGYSKLSKMIFSGDVTLFKDQALSFLGTPNPTVDLRNCTSVPTLEKVSSWFSQQYPGIIIVPDALYNEWIAATNWSSLTNVVFVKASEYVGV